jgi:hypothetical protein
VRILQKRFHVAVQLIVLPLQEEDLRDVDGHHFGEILIRLQLAEADERCLMVGAFVLDV